MAEVGGHCGVEKTEAEATKDIYGDEEPGIANNGVERALQPHGEQ